MTTTSPAENPHVLAMKAERKRLNARRPEQVLWDERIETLLAHLEDEHGTAEEDSSIPGAAKSERYAVALVDNDPNRQHGTYLARANSLERATRLAEQAFDDGLRATGVYDLATLDGPEPGFREGDRVTYDREEDHPGRVYWVVQTDLALYEGEPYTVLWLDPDEPGIDPDDAEYQEIDCANVTLVEAEEPDERLPVRHALAALRVVVAFDTVPGR